MSPSKFQQDYTDIDSPLVIVFNYPVIGGTHMNVVFDQQGSTVVCMEPFYPYPGEDNKRTGRYVRRPTSFFGNSAQIGVGCLPLADAGVQDPA